MGNCEVKFAHLNKHFVDLEFPSALCSKKRGTLAFASRLSEVEFGEVVKRFPMFFGTLRFEPALSFNGA